MLQLLHYRYRLTQAENIHSKSVTCKVTYMTTTNTNEEKRCNIILRKDNNKNNLD